MDADDSTLRAFIETNVETSHQLTRETVETQARTGPRAPCSCGGDHAPKDCPLAHTPDAVPDAVSVPTEEEARTDKDAQKDAQGKAAFGGMTPSEAAQLRWAQHRARQQDAEALSVHEAGDEAMSVRVSVQTGAIIKRLARDAKAGNVQAARELRAYLAEVSQDSETSVSSLDKRTRARVLDRILAELDAEEEAAATTEGATPANDGTPVL